MQFQYSEIESLHHVKMRLAHQHNIMSNWVRLLNEKNERIGLTDTETMILHNAILELDRVDLMCVVRTVNQ